MPETTTEQPKKEFPFSIGADPELNVCLGDKRISASGLFRKALSGAQEVVENGKRIGGIGTDCGDVAELRPTESKTPKETTENIGKLIKRLAERCGTFSFKTTSEGSPVGGHIHIEIPKNIATNQKKLDWINNIISSFHLPILLGEDSLNIKMRTNGGGAYGKLGDKRIGSHPNGKYTFEYRTPTAEWMTSPKITEATFAYVATVFNEILHHPGNIKKYNDIVFKNLTQAEALQELAVSQFIGVTETLLKKISKAVKTFEFYPFYEEEIEYILSPKKVIADKRKADFEVLTGWGLRTTPKITLKNLFDRKQIAEKLKDVDLDDIKSSIEILYNKDYNVDILVSYIKERIIALNWQLKHRYVFFGFRKGLPTIVMNAGGSVYSGTETIKTEEDYNKTKKVFASIKETYLDTIDVKRNDGDYAIIFGIDYETRQNQNWTKIIKTIFQIENGKIKPKKLELMNDDKLSDAVKKDTKRFSNILKQLKKIKKKVDEENHNDIVVSFKKYEPPAELETEEIVENDFGESN